MASSKRRRFLRALALIILGALVIVAALPLWFPWILRSAAKRFGATYAHYERNGYQRFRLTGLEFTNQSGRFEAKQVEAFVPTVWLWRCFVGPKSQPFLEVNSWTWKSRSSAARKKRQSVYEDVQKTAGRIATLEKWLPQAMLTSGTVLIKNQTVNIRKAVWSDGKLSAQMTVPRLANKTFRLRAAAQSVAPLKLDLNLNATALQLYSHLTVTMAGNQLSLQGTALWMSNQVQLKARLPEHGIVPDTASVQADSFEIPARQLNLGHYRNLTGSLDANWSNNQLRLNLTAEAQPRSANWPPVHIQARASGNTNSAELNVANISIPWLDARLLHPLRILFKPPYLAHPTMLEITGNLTRQPWLAAKGKFTGQALLRPGTARFPVVSFKFNGTGLSISNITAKTFVLDGNLRWPQLELTNANMELADGSRLSLIGAFNFQKRTVQKGLLHFSGGFGRHYLPSTMTYRTASLAAQFAGPLHTLTNSATLRVEGLQIPHSNPMHLKANWHGRGMNLQQMEVALGAGNSVLLMHGSAQLGGSKMKLHVASLELNRSNRTELQLQQAFEAIFQRHPSSSSNAWTATFPTAVYSGKNGSLRLAAAAAWPQMGAFKLSARHLNSRLIQDFFKGGTPNAELKRLNFTGGWTNGPAAFQLGMATAWQTKNDLKFEARAEVDGSSMGISIPHFSVSSGTQKVCHVQGSMPVLIEPSATNNLIRINPDGAVRLQATTQTNSVLWNEIADLAGVLLGKPRLQADIDGTWTAPRGQITLQAERVRFPHIKHPLPALENIALTAKVSRGQLSIPQFQFKIQGQPVEFTALMPLRKHFWSTLVSRKQLPDWRQATARLKIQNAKLARFADLMPETISPQGTLRADVTLQPGGVLGGQLVLTNVATRPLATLGIIRDIQGTVIFNSHAATLTNFSAAIGGQPITADGRLPLTTQTFHSHGLPPFVIRLHGTDLPLVRQPSLLLRANMDLSLTNPASGPGMVTGKVTLRDSLFLANLQSLIPQNTSAPKEHPPYFSVTAQPWAGWHLNLQVQGNQFMRVQTPVFQGKVSVAMKLENTLHNPLALGEVKIASGAVTFPFGSLKVDQGYISLTSDDPYHPQLFITAQSQQFGYNVKLEVTGTADEPIVQFSSTPPLSSQQIVMMLTTGQIPGAIGATTSTLRRAEGLGLFFGKNLLSEFGFGLGEKNRLTFHSGQQISESGRPTYQVDYKISKRWSIIGEYDRFDQYNLNLKWNIYTK